MGHVEAELKKFSYTSFSTINVETSFWQKLVYLKALSNSYKVFRRPMNLSVCVNRSCCIGSFLPAIILLEESSWNSLITYIGISRQLQYQYLKTIPQAAGNSLVRKLFLSRKGGKYLTYYLIRVYKLLSGCPGSASWSPLKTLNLDYTTTISDALPVCSCATRSLPASRITQRLIEWSSQHARE